MLKLIKYLILVMIVGMFFSGCSSKIVYGTFEEEKPFFNKIFNVLESEFEKHNDTSVVLYKYKKGKNDYYGGSYAQIFVDMDKAWGLTYRYMNYYINKRYKVIKIFKISDDYLTSKKKNYQQKYLFIVGDGSVSIAVIRNSYEYRKNVTIEMKTVVRGLTQPYTQYLTKEFNLDYLPAINQTVEYQYEKFKNEKKNKRILNRAAEDRKREASIRSRKAWLGGINEGLSTVSSDWNRINNNNNAFPSTRSTPKRWQDMTENEKQVYAENYKYLKGSEVKKKVSTKQIKSTNTITATYYSRGGTDKVNTSLNGQKVAKVTWDLCFTFGSAKGKCSQRHAYITSYESTKHATNYNTCFQGTDCDSYSKLISATKEYLNAGTGSTIRNFSVQKF